MGHNFIQTLSIQEQREIHSWLTFTLFIILATLITLICIDSMHICRWQQMRRAYAQEQKRMILFDQAVAHKKKIITDLTTINIQNAKIQRYQKQVKNPYQLLQALLSIDDKVLVDSLTIEHKKIRLSANAATEQMLINWIDHVKKTGLLCRIQLQQLKKVNQQRYTAIIMAQRIC